ncbi:hypothetical protein BpHYR1_023725 [Brachionus plicatilis]|uniref:Uncharacterized protein n=1 Tax=Brachionus plicatilis TaxID=10195 RepID=A0A3M7RUB1_BRAPC|nr:hypothetical protein BpHYR1_023725 [Brachionus plicatilis]
MWTNFYIDITDVEKFKQLRIRLKFRKHLNKLNRVILLKYKTLKFRKESLQIDVVAVLTKDIRKLILKSRIKN